MQRKRRKGNRNGNVNENSWGRGDATPPTGRGRRRRRLEPKGPASRGAGNGRSPCGGDYGVVTKLLYANIVLCTSGIKDFVYQRAEGELINRIFNATSA